MSTTSVIPEVETLDARAYRHRHAGKLMVVHHNGKQPCDALDFFLFESAGTHPSGVFVTGIFDHSQRQHMLATGVREATAAEIEWRRSAADTKRPPINQEPASPNDTVLSGPQLHRDQSADHS
jgi:hypothetical protein